MSLGWEKEVDVYYFMELLLPDADVMFTPFED
jgi:hypothetical protein